jgi:AhpC/TSA antioxidant enzyme
LAFIYQAEESQAKKFFSRYKAEHIERFSDQAKELYQAFGLERGNLSQLFSIKTFTRGFEALRNGGHFVGKPVGDVWQMPGVFLVYKGEILRSFKHESAGDIPDYEAMSVCEI